MQESIEITLNRYEDFFQTPTLDLSTPVTDSEILQKSGIEYLFHNFYAKTDNFNSLIINVVEKSYQDQIEKFKSAIAIYCEKRIHELKTNKKIITTKSLGRLARGFVVTLILSALLFIWINIFQDREHGALYISIEAFLSVFAWVILWFPIETLLYGKIDEDHEIKFLKKLQSIPITVTKSVYRKKPFSQ